MLAIVYNQIIYINGQIFREVSWQHMLISVLKFSYSQLNIFEKKHAYFISNSVSQVSKLQAYMYIILYSNLVTHLQYAEIQTNREKQTLDEVSILNLLCLFS